MASIRTVAVSHPFPSTLNPQSKPNFTYLFLSPPPRATDPNSTEPNTYDTASGASASSNSESTAFESRLSKVRLKYRSGTGKKAEQRRAKTKKKSSSSSSNGRTMMLPPVPLKEPVSATTGFKVELGFTPYSERLNGAVAGLGLVALLLVELGSGQGLFKYHAGPTVLIQIYTVTALVAVFVKYERERISVWPEIEIPLAAPTTATTEE